MVIACKWDCVDFFFVIFFSNVYMCVDTFVTVCACVFACVSFGSCGFGFGESGLGVGCTCMLVRAFIVSIRV